MSSNQCTKKITLTQFQRYLPLTPPPKLPQTLICPEHIKRFLISPYFNNLSLKEQQLIKNKYHISYRNYYLIEDTIQHVWRLTARKYSKSSIETALKNLGGGDSNKERLVDWYKFYRKIIKSKASDDPKSSSARIHRSTILKNLIDQQHFDAPSKITLSREVQEFKKSDYAVSCANKIKRQFRRFLIKKRVWKGIQEVEELRKSLEPKLIIEFSRQGQKQVQDFYQKNKYQSDKILATNYAGKDQMNFIELQQMLNSKLEMYIDRKKVVYIYLYFDSDNKGKLDFRHFKEVIFNIKKAVLFVPQKEYLSSSKMVLESLRKDMREIYIDAQEMEADFMQNYCEGKAEKEDQISVHAFQKFIHARCDAKYSRYQIRAALKEIGFRQNLSFLYNEPRSHELSRNLIKLTNKKRRRVLHSENEVFYSFKQMLLLIVAKCKHKKLDRDGFKQFIVSQDPSLKFNSFFSVFRVYGDLINIERIKDQCGLEALSCWLKLLKSEEQFDAICEDLVDAYPQDLELPFSSVVDKLNISLDFLIESQKIGILESQGISAFEMVNYKEVASRVIQRDFDIIARSYIHRKVSSKFVQLYRNMKRKQRQNQSVGINLLGKALEATKKKYLCSSLRDSIESDDSKSKPKSNKRLSTEKSILSRKSIESGAARKYQPEDLSMMKSLLFGLVDHALTGVARVPQHSPPVQFSSPSQEPCIREKLILTPSDQISYRSSVCHNFDYHQMLGLLIQTNDQLYQYSQQKKSQQPLQIKVPYRPNIQILSFVIFQGGTIPEIVILTSYFTLQFYKLYQNTKYPYKTVKIGTSRQNEGSKSPNYNTKSYSMPPENFPRVEIEHMVKSCQFGAYPKLLKGYGQELIVNMSFVERKIWLISGGSISETKASEISFSKRQHHFNVSVGKFLLFLQQLKLNESSKNNLILFIVDFFDKIKPSQNKSQRQQIVPQHLQLTQRSNLSQNFTKKGPNSDLVQKEPNIDPNQSDSKPAQEKGQDSDQESIREPKMKKFTLDLQKVANPVDGKSKPLDLSSQNINSSNVTETEKKHLSINLKQQLERENEASSTNLPKIAAEYFEKFTQMIKSFAQMSEEEPLELPGQYSLSEFDFLQIYKYATEISKELFECQLRQETRADSDAQSKRSQSEGVVPQQIREVASSIADYLFESNLSLKDLINQLDSSSEGYIKTKKVKDYLLKITQGLYMIHEKGIDHYLRNVSIGRHISYGNFLSIFSDCWNYKVWERPHLIVKDYEYIAEYSLLLYTLDCDSVIYVKDLRSNKIVGRLIGHRSEPSICLVKERMVLISGDTSSEPQQSALRPQHSGVALKLWRLHEDLILKMTGIEYPLTVTPFYTSEDSIHKKGITDICYLTKCDLIVTSSLDSTVKLHKIFFAQGREFRISEIDRIYADDCYFLRCKSYLLSQKSSKKNKQSEQNLKPEVSIQSLLTLRIKKHINHSNANKYELTAQKYNVQMMRMKVSASNQYIEIPRKMCQKLQHYAGKILRKKNQFFDHSVRSQMERIVSDEFVGKSLEDSLFNSIKTYYIFKDPFRLSDILNYISKKESGSEIVESIFKKYGLNIVSIDNELIGSHDFKSAEEQLQTEAQKQSYQNYLQNYQPSELALKTRSENIFIQLPSEEYHRMVELLKKSAFEKVERIHSQTQNDSSRQGQQQAMISVQKCKGIIQMFVYNEKQLKLVDQMINRQKQNIRSKRAEVQKTSQMQQSVLNRLKSSSQPNNSVQSHQQKNDQSAPLQQINLSQCLKLFKPYEPSTQVEKFYIYLTQLLYTLQHKKVPIWRLFANSQENISKQKMVSFLTLKQQIVKIGMSSEKAETICSFLDNRNGVSILDLTQQIKVALQYNKNSLIGASQSHSHNGSASEIILGQSMILQRNRSQLTQNQSGLSHMQESAEYNALNLHQKIQEEPDKLSESGGVSKRSRSLQRSLEKVGKSRQRSMERSQSGSKKLTRSNSFGNQTQELSFSHTKDSKKRQIHEIRQKLLTLFHNQKKSLWELACSAVPQFLEELFISEAEFFDMFKLLKSPLRLGEKLSIMNFLRELSPSGSISLNDLFQLFEEPIAQKSVPAGEKYIIPYLINKLLGCYQQIYTVEQGIEVVFFQEFEEISMEDILERCSREPFEKLNHFALKELEQILIKENKASFNKEDLLDMIDRVVGTYDLKIDTKSISIMEEILFKIDKRKVEFEEIFPQPKNNVTEQYFVKCVHGKISNKSYDYKTIVKDYETIKSNVAKSMRKSKSLSERETARAKSAVVGSKSSAGTARLVDIPYGKFKAEVKNLLDETRQSADRERESARKLVRYLQNKRIGLFHFFVALDVQKKYFLNEIQFQTGLNEVGIYHSFWGSIPKRCEHRLYYSELIRYLAESGVLDIKSVDSELQIAMEKLLRRVIRTADIEHFYLKLVASDEQRGHLVTYESFSSYMRTFAFFSKKELFYLFSTFCNARQIQNSKFSNDELIRDESNLNKTFNYKDFLDVVSIYRTETITKTPQFKFMEYFKKRGVSLINEFKRFLQKNRKIKEVSEALKNNSAVLSKELVLRFIQDANTGLNEKELKQMLSMHPSSEVDFALLSQKLDQIYKRGSSYLEQEESEAYLAYLYKASVSMDVSIERLFADYCQSNRLVVLDLNRISEYLQTGLNKIQIRKVYDYLDAQNKGFVTLSETIEAIEDVSDKIEKEDDYYQFEYVIEKIQQNRSKLQIKETQIAFPLRKCIAVFEKCLSTEEIELFYSRLLNSMRKGKGSDNSSEPNESDALKFINGLINQKHLKSDKKYKQLVLNLLKSMRKSNLDISETFKYLTLGATPAKGSIQVVLSKERFLLLYQSIGHGKVSILDVNNLYQYLDENKTGYISAKRWEEKLGMVDMESQMGSDSSRWQGDADELRVFYKVKVFLSEVYLALIQKEFRAGQIFRYFDRNGTGEIRYNEFWWLVLEIGKEASEELQRKVVNYLDRDKQRVIQVKVLVEELQNCLGEKEKLVLETKTSFIFKRNCSLLRPNYRHLMRELIGKEQLVESERRTHSESCILVTEFLETMKRFGVRLSQEEIIDMRRNLSYQQGYFQLYPLYFMIKETLGCSPGQSECPQPQELQQETELYSRLLQAMVANKITVKQISKRVKSQEQLASMLKQLKAFTPIEIDIIVQGVSLVGSSVIDVEKLKIKVRDSYVGKATLNTRNLTGSTSTHAQDLRLDEHSQGELAIQDEDMQEHIRRFLREQVGGFEAHMPVLSKYPQKLSLGDFSGLLTDGLNLKLLKSDIKRYFSAFASTHGTKGANYIDLQDLLFEPKPYNLDDDSSQNIHAQSAQSDQLEILLEHILKSLTFTGKSLGTALQKYFAKNYGFISEADWKMFLQETGYETSEPIENQNKGQAVPLSTRAINTRRTTVAPRIQKKVLREFKDLYTERFLGGKANQSVNESLQFSVQNLAILIEDSEPRREPNEQRIDVIGNQKQLQGEFRKIVSKQIGVLALGVSRSFAVGSIDKWLEERQITNKTMTTSELFEFVRLQIVESARPENCQIHAESAIVPSECSCRMFCSMVGKNTFKLPELERKVQNLIRFSYMNSQPQDLKHEGLLPPKPATQRHHSKMKPLGSSHSRHQVSQELQLFDSVNQHNFVYFFSLALAHKFIPSFQNIGFSTSNLHRIASNVLLESINKTQFLLSLKPNLKGNTSSLTDSCQIRKISVVRPDLEITVSHPSSSSLIISSERTVPEKSLYIINQTHFALPAHKKEEFHNLSVIATHLSGSAVEFSRVKGYFIWKPAPQKMPSKAIRYRWKYIPLVAQKMLEQLRKVHEVGYCCPHLRFEDLNGAVGSERLSQKSQKQTLLIDRVYNGCKVDKTGTILELWHPELFSAEDSYCPPQVYSRPRSQLTHKVDTWVFGCLLYEFIWGHEPSGYFSQLESFLESRSSNWDLQRVLAMSEPPSEFQYRFCNFEKIQQLYRKDFFFKSAKGKGNKLSQNAKTDCDLELQINKWQSFVGLTKPLEQIFGDQISGSSGPLQTQQNHGPNPMLSPPKSQLMMPLMGGEQNKKSEAQYLKYEVELLSEIHRVIQECLNPNPDHRPSIQTLLSRSIFPQTRGINQEKQNKDQTLSEYLSILSGHQDSQQLEQQFIEPIFSRGNLNDSDGDSRREQDSIKTNDQKDCFHNSEKVDGLNCDLSVFTAELMQYLTESFNKNVSFKTNPFFTIPKAYPWPGSTSFDSQNQQCQITVTSHHNKFMEADKLMGSKSLSNRSFIISGRNYSKNMEKYREVIRQSPNFDMICRFFQSDVALEIIKALLQSKKTLHQNNDQISAADNEESTPSDYAVFSAEEEAVGRFLLSLLELFKTYESPASGFVLSLLNCIFHYIYESPEVQLSSDPTLLSEFSYERYLKLPNISVAKAQFVKKLQRTVLVNGFASSEFCVLSDYLSEQESARQSIEAMYCALDLCSATERCELAINYFRDRVYMCGEPFYSSLRVEVLVLRNIHQPRIKNPALCYFCELIAYRCSCPASSAQDRAVLPPLFTTPIFYANLNIIIRNPIEKVENKCKVLEIICLLLEGDYEMETSSGPQEAVEEPSEKSNLRRPFYKAVLSTMRMSSNNVFQYLVRLLVEPHHQLAQHDDYERLRDQLDRLVRIIETNLTLHSIFEEQEGGLYVLNKFSQEV